MIEVKATDSLNAASSWVTKWFRLDTNFRFPVGKANTRTWDVSQEYDIPVSGRGYHTGVDFNLAGWQDLGKPVYAAGQGKVVYSGYSRGYGNVIVIKHWTHLGPIYTLYAHLQTRLVQNGSPVLERQKIGTVGSTGIYSTGPHLHFAVYSQACYDTFKTFLVPGYTTDHPGEYGFYRPIRFIHDN